MVFSTRRTFLTITVGLVVLLQLVQTIRGRTMSVTIDGDTNVHIRGIVNQNAKTFSINFTKEKPAQVAYHFRYDMQDKNEIITSYREKMKNWIVISEKKIPLLHEMQIREVNDDGKNVEKTVNSFDLLFEFSENAVVVYDMFENEKRPLIEYQNQRLNVTEIKYCKFWNDVKEIRDLVTYNRTQGNDMLDIEH